MTTTRRRTTPMNSHSASAATPRNTWRQRVLATGMATRPGQQQQRDRKERRCLRAAGDARQRRRKATAVPTGGRGVDPHPDRPVGQPLPPPEGLAGRQAEAQTELRRRNVQRPPARLAGRRRDCHSAAPPLPLVGVSIGMERVCQQNDRSLADGGTDQPCPAPAARPNAC